MNEYYLYFRGTSKKRKNSKCLKRFNEKYDQNILKYIIKFKEDNIAYIDKDDAQKYKEYLAVNNSKKIKLRVLCKVCNQYFFVSCYIDYMQRLKIRKFNKNQDICNQCRIKDRHEEWSKIQSRVQSQVQNYQWVKKKNSQGIKKAYRDKPYLRQQMSKIMKKVYQQRGSEIKYKQLQTKIKNGTIGKQGGSLNGVLYNILYQSSYQKYFIYFCFKNNIKIERCKLILPYIYNEKLCNYHPDFQIVYNNKKYIVEIKGYERDKNRLNQKNKTVLKYCKDNNIDYLYLFKKDFFNFVGVKNHREIYIKLNQEVENNELLATRDMLDTIV